MWKTFGRQVVILKGYFSSAEFQRIFFKVAYILLFTLFSEKESSPSDAEVISYHSLKQMTLWSILQFIVKLLWLLCYLILAVLCAFSFLSKIMSGW